MRSSAKLSQLSAMMLIFGLLWLGLPAYAGGWATTTIDDVPDELVAGREYRLHYTVLQHGKTPIDIEGTGVVLVKNGERLEFAGESAGEVGRYVVTLAVPSAGEWRWEMEQGFFAPQDLGVIQAAPAPAGARTGLTVGLVLVAGAIGIRILRRLLPTRTRRAAVAGRAESAPLG